MSKEIYLQDNLLIDQPVNEQAKTDAESMLKDGKNAKLKIVVDATHSGVRTNNRVYPGRKVAAGFKSFFDKKNGGTAEYNKPVLLHHEDHNDPVGRVYNAIFTPLKTGRDFELDYENPDEVGSKGSGVVTVNAEIADPEAIKKILDGRYITVSAGHSTDAMYCSICGGDIYGKDCMHIPGKSYDAEGEEVSAEDGTKCFAITNNMTYHELSFVNFPAQPPAKILEYNWEDKANYDGKSFIGSYLRAKKEIIKSCMLSDENTEISLLTGSVRSTQQKIYSIASSTAEKLRNKLTEGQKNTMGEPANDRSSSSQEPKSAAKPEAKDTISSKEKTSINKPLKETKMEIDESKMTELQTEITKLKSDLATAEKDRDALKDQVAVKTQEIDTLKKSSDELKTEIAASLATALASLKIRLGKPDTKGLTDETRKTYIESLAKRSVSSLKDSIADLLIEVESAPVASASDEDPEAIKAADALKESKLESNTLGSGKGKTAKKGKQDTLSSILN